MVDVITIPATLRTEFGKGYSRRVRANDQIPAVIYGHGAEPLHVILPGHEMMLASRNSNAVLEIDVDGEGHLAMIKDVQRHPVRPEILHIDLLTVRRGERVEVEVPLSVAGEVAPTAVHNLEENVLLIEADALKVPEHFEIDIEGREPGEHTRGDGTHEVQLCAGSGWEAIRRGHPECAHRTPHRPRPGTGCRCRL